MRIVLKILPNLPITVIEEQKQNLCKRYPGIEFVFIPGHVFDVIDAKE